MCHLHSGEVLPGLWGVALWDGGQSGGLGDSRLYIELITKCCDLQLGPSLPERSHLLMAPPNPEMEACLMDYHTSSTLLPLCLWAPLHLHKGANTHTRKHTLIHTHTLSHSHTRTHRLKRKWLVTVLRARWLLWVPLNWSIMEHFLNFTSHISHSNFTLKVDVSM